MLGMRTETRRGLVAAGAALIALTILATLSPIPQFLVYYVTKSKAAGIAAGSGALYAYGRSGAARAVFALGTAAGAALAGWLGLSGLWFTALAVGVGIVATAGVAAAVFIAVY